MVNTVHDISFISDRLVLQGNLHIPEGLKPGERRPAFIVLHGFAGSKDYSHAELMANMFADWGYVALRFDFRGCGDSEGERGYILCHDQVADTKNALNWLLERPEVDPKAVGLIGHSFGGAVASYTGAIEQRFAAIISSCGWGNGERKFRGQHPGPMWDKFMAMLDKAEEEKQRTGRAPMVPRFDVVPMAEHLRKNTSPKIQLSISADTARSMFDFKAEEVIHWVSPRPILFIHGADDTVTPTEQSIRMWELARQPKELALITGIDHFPLAEGGHRVRSLIKGWLDRYLPVAN